MRFATLFGVVSVVAVTACGTSSARSCVRVPQTIPESRLATNDSRLTVPVGAVVFDVLVESANENGPGFPWVTPISSDLTVLAPVRLCKRTGVSSLALTVTGFRARHAGAAILTAALSPRWRSIRARPKPSRDEIAVN